MYTIHLTASFIRIDANQIQWYNYGRFHASGLWTRFRCLPSRTAFCSIVDSESSVLILPSGVVDMPVDQDLLRLPAEFERFLQSINGQLCTSATANRMLSYTDNRYEISMCDMVDGELEVVFIPGTNVLYVRQHHENTIFVLLLSLLSLYLFVQTCEHFIQLSRGRRKGFEHKSITIPFIVASVLFAKVVLVENVLVVVEETILQLILILYTLMHTSIRLWLHTRKTDDSADSVEEHGGTAIGVLLTTQVLLSLELNFTIASPFLQIYVCVFGIRNFLKFLNLLLRHYKKDNRSLGTHLKKTCELLSDVFVFGCLISIGIKLSSENTDVYVSTTANILLVSILGGTLAHSITSLHSPAH